MGLYDYLQNAYKFFFTPTVTTPRGKWPWGDKESVYHPLTGRYITKEEWEQIPPEKITGFKKLLIDYNKQFDRAVATPKGK